VVFAIGMGAVGTLLAFQSILYAAALFTPGMAVSVYCIDGTRVNHEAGRR
jgi:hypothetical protein